jgi:hypothetical protein
MMASVNCCTGILHEKSPKGLVWQSSEGYVVGMIGRRGKGIGDDYKGKDGVLADAMQVVHRG